MKVKLFTCRCGNATTYDKTVNTRVGRLCDLCSMEYADRDDAEKEKATR